MDRTHWDPRAQRTPHAVGTIQQYVSMWRRRQTSGKPGNCSRRSGRKDQPELQKEARGDQSRDVSGAVQPPASPPPPPLPVAVSG